MEKMIALIISLVLVFALSLALFFAVTPEGVAAWNTWFGTVQKADDATNYETQKKVEDTCRAMIASYQADALTYDQYKDSDNDEKQSWAEQARMRANKTASSYNNYVTENRFIWRGNIPADVPVKLNYIE